MTSLEKALRDFAQLAAKLKGDERLISSDCIQPMGLEGLS